MADTEPSTEAPGAPGRARFGTFVQTVTYRNIVLSALAAGLLLVGLLSADLVRARYQALDEARRQATTAAAVVAEHAALAISAVDNLLVNIRHGLSSGASAATMLDAAAQSHPYLRTIHVIDASGRVTASTHPGVVGLDVSDRRYYTVHRDALVATDRLWIGLPLEGRASGQNILPLSRRVTGPDGTFAGVIMGAVDRDYLAVFVATQALGLRGTVGLHSVSGDLVAGQTDPLDEAREDGDTPVIVATDRVRDLPLIVRVAIDRTVALAEWTTRAGVYGLVALGLIVLLVVLSGLLMLYSRRAREALDAAVARTVAERANRAKSDFVSFMSHELRTPVTAMDVIARDLEGTALDEGQRSHVATLRASAGYLLSLVGSVLDLARVEAGALELNQREFSPDGMLDQVERLMTPSAAAKGLRLSVERQALPTRVLGDAVRIQQVLLNLVGNAIKYTHRGTVTLSAAFRDGALVLTVSDTGPGLPAALRGDAFRRFAGGAAERDDSSGMGLSVAHRICEALGGRLTVEETTPAGTTLRFAVPVHERPDRRIEARSGDDAAASASQGVPRPAAPAVRPRATQAATRAAVRDTDRLTLLLAEDDPAQGKVFRATLSGWGHEVQLFGHGAAALEAARRTRFDALIVDVHLPGLNGTDIVRRLRAEGDPVPVIGLTAALFSEDLARYRGAGFDHLLVKPVPWEELRDLLARLRASDGSSPSMGPSTAAPRQ